MRGVILCGGLGTRLLPLTAITNKHLLNIYDRPMCFYPIQTLVEAGITSVMVIVSGPHSGDFIQVLKNGSQLGLEHLEYAYQEKPNGGIADALALAEDFADGDPIAVILGDNTTDANLKQDVTQFSNYVSNNILDKPYARIFLKEVDDPERFGIAEFDKTGKLTGIVEKPKNPPSNYAVTGLYMYDQHVFDFIRQCEPSARGELEVTDINNLYLQHGNLDISYLKGYWQDAGTFKNLYLANKYWAEKALKDEEAIETVGVSRVK